MEDAAAAVKDEYEREHKHKGNHNHNHHDDIQNGTTKHHEPDSSHEDNWAPYFVFPEPSWATDNGGGGGGGSPLLQIATSWHTSELMPPNERMTWEQNATMVG